MILVGDSTEHENRDQVLMRESHGTVADVLLIPAGVGRRTVTQQEGPRWHCWHCWC